MKIWNYRSTPLHDRRYEAQIEDGPARFIKFAGKWEFYAVAQKGRYRGMSTFMGYVDEPMQLSALEQAFKVVNERTIDGKIIPFDTETPTASYMHGWRWTHKPKSEPVRGFIKPAKLRQKR